MRLVVFGGWFGSMNLGDDAILIGLRNVLGRAMPGVELVALSTDPGYAASRLSSSGAPGASSGTGRSTSGCSRRPTAA